MHKFTDFQYKLRAIENLMELKMDELNQWSEVLPPSSINYAVNKNWDKFIVIEHHWTRTTTRW